MPIDNAKSIELHPIVIVNALAQYQYNLLTRKLLIDTTCNLGQVSLQERGLSINLTSFWSVVVDNV
jgi:hypothetical protein